MFELNSPRALVSGALEVLGEAVKEDGASEVDEDGPVMQILRGTLFKMKTFFLKLHSFVQK